MTVTIYLKIPYLKHMPPEYTGPIRVFEDLERFSLNNDNFEITNNDKSYVIPRSSVLLIEIDNIENKLIYTE